MTKLPLDRYPQQSKIELALNTKHAFFLLIA